MMRRYKKMAEIKRCMSYKDGCLDSRYGAFALQQPVAASKNVKVEQVMCCALLKVQLAPGKTPKFTA